MEVDDGEGKTFDIATAQDFIKFVENVNSGMTKASARLTADINLLAYRSSLKPIGTPAWPYTGTFDGQGHVIKNTNCMLFGTVSGATIRNVRLTGGTLISNVAYAAHTGTLVGCCEGDEPTTISHCFSDVKIASASNDAGGLVGKLYGTLEHCYYMGTLRGSSTMGGLIGSSYSEDKPAKVKDSYVLSTLMKSTGTCSGLLAGWLHDSSSVANCYVTDKLALAMFGNLGDTMGDNHLASTEDFASGSVCWGLNGGQSDRPQWFQTLQEDAAPVLDDTHGVVYCREGAYTNVSADALLPVPAEERALVDVHDMDGRLLRRHVPRGKALQGLPRGMYVVDGKKVAK